MGSCLLRVKIHQILGVVALLPCFIYASNMTKSNRNITTETAKALCEEKVSGNSLFVTILVCVFVIGLLGNGLAVTVILFSRKLRHQSTNLFVASLNLCDIGVILFILPLRINEYVYGNNFCFDIHVCRFFNIADSLFHISSISHLFVMAIERFIAVRVPFLYHRKVNKSVAIKVICATWLYSIVWASSSLVKWSSPTGPSTRIAVSPHGRSCMLENPIFFICVQLVVYIIPLTIMAVLYSLILRTALESQKVISSLSPKYLRQDEHTNEHTAHKRKQEVNASKTVAIIYGAFTVCWLPLSIITILQISSLSHLLQFKKDHPTLSSAIFTTFIVILPAIHSCLNPFIYIIFHEKFRKAFKNLFSGKFKRWEGSFRRNASKNLSFKTETVAL